MKRLTLATVSVLALAAAPLLAEGNAWTRRPRVVQRPGSSSLTATKATAAGYSVQLNIVTRVMGILVTATAFGLLGRGVGGLLPGLMIAK